MAQELLAGELFVMQWVVSFQPDWHKNHTEFSSAPQKLSNIFWLFQQITL